MRKIFHSSAKLIVNDSDIDKPFGSIHQSAMTKIKKNNSQDWAFKTIVEHGLISNGLFLWFFSAIINRNNSIKKWR